jgi:hypothetical protein
MYWRNRPVRSSAQHLALVEAAVADYAVALWERTAPAFLRWLRWVFAVLRAKVALRSVEEANLAEAIQAIAAQIPQNLQGDLATLANTITLQYGFLPSDPRAAALEASFRQLIQSDLGHYWASLVDPEVLAQKIVALQGQGKTLDQIARLIELEYAAKAPAAERMVRTLYNSGANAAQMAALEGAGYTHKQWLATPGRRTRLAHQQANGQQQLLSEPFVVGGASLMYPGDRSLGAPPNAIINCRCTVIGINKEAATAEEK